VKYRLTVYHDGGKGVKTYPELYTLDQARAKVASLFRDGCEMPATSSGEIVFYPPFRVWKVIAEPKGD
jgi:hypothetical protein